MANSTRVSIDAGQSSIRVRLEGSTAQEMTLPGVRNDRSTIGQIAEVLAAHHGWSAASVAVGLSGYDDDLGAPAALLAAAPMAERAAIAHDSVTGYLGANGDAHGVVAAVGTGVVVLGVGPEGVVRVDGWGALLGDAGGAYWIGRAGIDAALRAHDGRGLPTSLTARAAEMFGPLDLLALAIQGDEGRVARVAGFARVVTEAAGEDEVAAAIVDRAAFELGDSICSAVRRAGVDALGARISGTGQVLSSPTLASRLARQLADRVPGARLSRPLGAPIDGVARLHDLPEGHPLAASVFVAHR